LSKLFGPCLIPTQAPSQRLMGVLSPGDMLPEHEFGSVPLSSAVVKIGRSHICAPIACLLVLDRDNITWICLHEINDVTGRYR